MLFYIKRLPSILLRIANLKNFKTLHKAIFALIIIFTTDLFYLQETAKPQIKEISNARKEQIQKNIEKPWLINSIIFEAIKNNKLQDIKIMFNHGIDINRVISQNGIEPCKAGHNTKKMINILKSDGYTSIHIASLLGQAQIVKFLISKGARINQGNQYGFTPLHLASRKGNVEIVDLLLNSGARINQANVNGFKMGSTALHLAVINEKTEVIKKLLEKQKNNNIFRPRVNIYQKDLEGKTAVTIALKKQNKIILRLLLEYVYNGK